MRGTGFVVLAAFALIGCEPSKPGEASDAATFDEEPEHLPPEDIGDPIEAAKLVGYRTPKVEIDSRITGRDRQDLQVLVDSAVALIVRPQLAQTGAAVSAANPGVFLRRDLRLRNSEQIAKVLASPPASWSYLSTRLIVADGGAVTGRNRLNTPHALRIRIQRDRLRLWRSRNRVARSCALNTTAHEISHTLVSSPTHFRPVFTDTGPGSHVNRTFASYLTGNMVQCTFLRLTRRIDERGIGRCVPMWTAWNERTDHVAFQRGRCEGFNETEPVRWPKARA